MDNLNENVRRLMLEAGYAAPEIAGRAHKLVELLVKECARVAADHVGEIEGTDFDLTVTCYEHFGVKQ